MVRTHYLSVVDHIFDPDQQALGNQEIIQAPTDVIFAGIGQKCPPGIFNPLRIKMAEGIDKSMGQVLVDPGPFFG